MKWWLFPHPRGDETERARLVEVGTTNKTYLSDYRRQSLLRTALLLKVHTSNYRIVGFTSDVSIEELVGLGRNWGYL